MEALAKNLKVEFLDDPREWDSFVESSPQGTVFSSSAWLEAACGAQGGEARILAVRDGDRLVAGISYIHIARGPVKKATSPVLTPYGGVLYRPDPGKRGSEAESYNTDCAVLLIKRLNELYQHVFLVHSPEFTDVRPFTWAGWDENTRYTYLIDITDTDALWDMLERRVRTVIRNAETSLELGGRIGIGHFCKLYEQIYGERGRSLPVDTNVVESMAERILEAGLGEMRTVRDNDGVVISAMILVYDRDRVYAWLSGSAPGENASGAFSLLFWDAVKSNHANRSCLDMVGANIKSIAFFKKGFAGTLTPYYVTERYSSLISRFLLNAYTRIRKILR